MADPVWADGEAYEAYVGRWSRLVARDFLRLLALRPCDRLPGQPSWPLTGVRDRRSRRTA